jgi:hypothetical protein
MLPPKALTAPKPVAPLSSNVVQMENPLSLGGFHPHPTDQRMMFDDHYVDQYAGHPPYVETYRHPNSAQHEFQPNAPHSERVSTTLQLEYSCGSMVYDCSGLESRMESDSRARWGVSSDINDFNKSAVSTMDFSAISLDLYSALSDEEKPDGNPNETAPPGASNSIMLDSIGASMDLGNCFQKSSGMEDPPIMAAPYIAALRKEGASHQVHDMHSNGDTRNELTAKDLASDRYSHLKREESEVTVVTGARSRHPRDREMGGRELREREKSDEESEESLAESFNMSLDLSALPRPLAARRASRRDAYRVKLGNDSTDSTTIQLPARAGHDSTDSTTIQLPTRAVKSGQQSGETQFDALEPIPVQASSMQNAPTVKNQCDSHSDDSLLSSLTSFVSVPSVR